MSFELQIKNAAQSSEQKKGENYEKIYNNISNSTWIYS